MSITEDDRPLTEQEKIERDQSIAKLERLGEIFGGLRDDQFDLDNDGRIIIHDRAVRREVNAIQAWFELQVARDEAFLTIDQTGRVEMIAGHGPDLSDQGEATKRRMSHVEPCCWPLRLAFHAIRMLVRDDSRAAAWTRGWGCLWRVNVIGGPTWGAYRDRAEAIAAEIKYLEQTRLN